MRLRIQTFSPLPELKAWFIPEMQDAYETVFDLKKLLCAGIPQLRANQIHPQSLQLLLEGFELLNDSPVSAVRDGDLIIVKMAQHMKEYLASQTRKRKRNSNEYDRSPRKISLRSAVTPKSESEESSSESESDSSSQSSSDSSSSTSSSDSPTIIPLNNVLEPPQLGKLRLAKEPLIQPSKRTTHIPPGHGKPSTHSRNKRRKMKREYQKLAKAGSLSQPKAISEASKPPLGPLRTENITDSSSVPLSASLPQSSNEVAAVASLSTRDIISIPHENDRDSSSKYVSITSDQIMMGSLRNKNKKKGFKQTMTGPIPRKIVFPGGVEQGQSSESNPPLNGHAPQNPGDHRFSEASRPFHRLIPPSELHDLGQLPPNVFVTSVDVEKHIWGSQNDLSTKKREKKRKTMCGYEDAGGYGFEEDREQGGDQTYHEDLPYGDDAQAEGETLVAENGIDWGKAEKVWEASSPIQDIQQLTDGVVFGWKELAINPQTFTPEMLLFLARVITVTHEGAEKDIANVRIQFRQLQRPGVNEAAVAFGVADVSNEDAEGGDDIRDADCAAWSDVLGRQWRLVDM